jgi:L-aspartate oxidase
VTHIGPDRILLRFPRIHSTCLRHGVDITKEPVPVTPAAHYVMGGVASDLQGRSTLRGLYVAGEVACNGVHGANRLASNSLLEGLVFGSRAAEAMVQDALALPPERAESWNGRRPADGGEPAGVREPGARSEADADTRQALRRQAWENMGLRRDAAGLQALVGFLDGLRPTLAQRPPTRAAAELRNLADVAHAMARSALFREESRGGHYRADFPERDDRRFLGHTRLAGRGPDLDPHLVPVEGPASSEGAWPGPAEPCAGTTAARR